jgi:hypothetical protein
MNHFFSQALGVNCKSKVRASWAPWYSQNEPVITGRLHLKIPPPKPCSTAQRLLFVFFTVHLSLGRTQWESDLKLNLDFIRFNSRSGARYLVAWTIAHHATRAPPRC